LWAGIFAMYLRRWRLPQWLRAEFWAKVVIELFS